MRTRTLLLAVLCCLLFAAPAQAHPPPPSNEWHPADPQQWLEQPWTRTLTGYAEDWGRACYDDAIRRGVTNNLHLAECWRPLAMIATTAYPVPGGADKMLRVLSCESSGDPDAIGFAADEEGLLQLHPEYSAEWATAAGQHPDLLMEPAANLLTGAWLANTDGWDPWSCRWA